MFWYQDRKPNTITMSESGLSPDRPRLNRAVATQYPGGEVILPVGDGATFFCCFEEEKNWFSKSKDNG